MSSSAHHFLRLFTEESWYCLVKGSPEALKHLMVPSSIPAWYTQSYEALARRGLRVLALAYKKVDTREVARPLEQPRAWVESNLHFGGFIAFECKVRICALLWVLLFFFVFGERLDDGAP